jgi:hypothetical protein
VTPRLADIGVTGFQMDVADGGDVDPETGRLLTIAEMQQALRIVRQQPLPAAHTTTATAEPGPAKTSSPDPATQDAADLDPFGWDTDRGWEPPQGVEEPSVPAVVPGRGRRGRMQTGEDVQVPSAGRRRRDQPPRDERSRAARFARRVLRLDRGPWKRNRDVDGWLPQHGDDLLAQAAEDAPDPVPAAGGSAAVRPRRGRRRGSASTAVTAGTVVGADFEVAGAPRGFAAAFWRWVARLLLLVLVLAGVNAVFVRPFRSATDAAPAVSGVDAAAAAAPAARFTADYLSYVSTAPSGNTAALTAHLPGSAGVSRLVFTGTGYVRADLVQTGQVAHVDDVHAVVAVTARLRLATPPAGGGQPDGAAAASPAAAAADPGPVPEGWTDLGSRWIALVVPVETTPAGLRVSAAGPVFSTEPAGQVTVPDVTTGIDADTVAATRDVAAAFFTGYAASNVAYLAAPGISMGGLGGAVTLASVDNWSVAIPTTAIPTTDIATTDTAGGADPTGPAGAAAATSGVGSGSVVWQLAGTELRVSQQYTVAMTHADGRWYAAALSPTRTTTP